MISANAVQEISPLPCPVAKQGKKPGKGAQAPELLTSTPYKTVLEDIRNKKSLQAAKRTLKFKSTDGPGTSAEGSRKKPKRASSRSSASIRENVAVEITADDWFCFICEESVVEDMVQCTLCRKWAHETCAGVQKQETAFLCDFCA